VFTKEYDQVAYVKITEFDEDTALLIDKYFSNLSSDYTNLIIDLRGNPGGYVSSVKEVFDLFVSKGKVVMSMVNKKGETTHIKTTDDSFYIFNEIVVLIDSQSASGAEALSAALNYHLDDIVTLYGETTYGKGSAQKTLPLGDGTYFHYTYALWNTPSGKTINKVGVTPEVSSINTGISSMSYGGLTLELYDYHKDILVLQTILKNEGLYSGTVHGFMDEDTVSALKIFQENSGLTKTGMIDKETSRYIIKLIYDDNEKYLNNEIESVLGSIFA
jgi:carboxyl-terminal processing protease